MFALVLALAAVQLGSDAIFSHAGESPSVPASLSSRTGTAIYRVIARIAPAPYVDDMLARAALDRGELAQAQAYANRMPLSVQRAELLARIALARGDAAAARRDFLAAGDVGAIDLAVDRLAAHDPAAAYRLEEQLKNRLERSGTHPDFVAESYWRLGVLAAQQAQARRAFAAYRTAAGLSPFSEKYLLSAGYAAYRLHAYTVASQYFARVISLNPASADGYAGARLVAKHLGTRAP